MKWGTRSAPEPQYKERARDCAYAWLPTPLTDGRWVWLEWYVRDWEYSEIPGDGDMFEGPRVGWHVLARLDHNTKEGTPNE